VDIRPTQPPGPLDDLLLRAERFAGFAMRQFGRVPPAMMAQCPKGTLFYMGSASRPTGNRCQLGSPTQQEAMRWPSS